MDLFAIDIYKSVFVRRLKLDAISMLAWITRITNIKTMLEIVYTTQVWYKYAKNCSDPDTKLVKWALDNLLAARM